MFVIIGETGNLLRVCLSMLQGWKSEYSKGDRKNDLGTFDRCIRAREAR